MENVPKTYVSGFQFISAFCITILLTALTFLLISSCNAEERIEKAIDAEILNLARLQPSTPSSFDDNLISTRQFMISNGD